MGKRIALYRCSRCRGTTLSHRGRASVLDGEQFWRCAQCGLTFGTLRSRIRLVAYLFVFALLSGVLLLFSASAPWPWVRVGATVAGVAVAVAGAILVTPDLFARRLSPSESPSEPDYSRWSDLAFIALDWQAIWDLFNPLRVFRDPDIWYWLRYAVLLSIVMIVPRECERRAWEKSWRARTGAAPPPALPRPSSGSP